MSVGGEAYQGQVRNHHRRRNGAIGRISSQVPVVSADPGAPQRYHDPAHTGRPDRRCESARLYWTITVCQELHIFLISGGQPCRSGRGPGRPSLGPPMPRARSAAPDCWLLGARSSSGSLRLTTAQVVKRLYKSSIVTTSSMHCLLRRSALGPVVMMRACAITTHLKYQVEVVFWLGRLLDLARRRSLPFICHHQQVPRGDERARVHKSTGMQHPTVWISAAGVAVPGCLTVWPSLTSPRDHLPASEIQSAGNTGEPHRPPHHMDGRFLPLIYRTSRATLASPPQPSVRLRAWASKIRKQPAPNSPSTRRRPLPVHTRLHELGMRPSVGPQNVGPCHHLPNLRRRCQPHSPHHRLCWQYTCSPICLGPCRWAKSATARFRRAGYSMPRRPSGCLVVVKWV